MDTKMATNDGILEWDETIHWTESELERVDKELLLLQGRREGLLYALSMIKNGKQESIRRKQI